MAVRALLVTPGPRCKARHAAQNRAFLRRGP